MSSILVTGGAGFIGSHTCFLLLKKGHTIFILDSFVNSSNKVIEKILLILKEEEIDCRGRIHLIEGDLKNKSDIEKVFQISIKSNNPIEGVIHFAGLKSVLDSILEPLNYWKNNVLGTLNLLEIMESYNCQTIVFSSSATVYKAESDHTLSEDDQCEPVNPYGQTKLTIEKILCDLYNSEPLLWRISCLRYFNPVGAHESGLIGEDPLCRASNIFPQITKVAVGKLEKIKIYGSDWPTPDGTGVRDYIHVMDLAEGHLSALDYLMNSKPQISIFNLGTGKGTSVLGLIKVFERINNVSIPFSFEDRRPGDKCSVIAKTSLAKSVLNWIPRRNIEDMCRDGWNWQVKNPNGY